MLERQARTDESQACLLEKTLVTDLRAEADKRYVTLRQELGLLSVPLALAAPTTQTSLLGVDMRPVTMTLPATPLLSDTP
jgi:hypothetical protein